MLIVKPYGRSQVHKKQKDQKDQRQIHKHQDGHQDGPVTAVDLLQSQDHLTLARWISLIDKVIRKPKPNKRPTEEQWRKRQDLGDACWTVMCNKNLLKCADKDKKKLKKRWEWKLHPYGDKNQSNDKKEIKGRWYDTFVEQEFEAKDIAQAFYQHLKENARAYRGEKQYAKGADDRVARAITRNTPDTCLKRLQNKTQWSSEDWNTYTKPDVAEKIYAKAKAFYCESEGKKKLHWTAAVEILKEHYALIFQDQGKCLPISQAKREQGSLFAVHEAVKACYGKLLKDRKSKPESLLRRLPENSETLKKLVEHQKSNRDINDLIRMGRVIHYHMFETGERSAETYCSGWKPEAFKTSPYWSSDGQTAIKQNEAFVRIWRNALAFAAHSLKDWADPENERGKDILDTNITKEICKSSADYTEKLPFLFGRHADKFKDSQNATDLLCFALKSIAAIRHKTFHFTGPEAFAKALCDGVRDQSPTIHKDIVSIFDEDLSALTQQPLDILRGIQIETYCLQSHIDTLLEALSRYNPLDSGSQVSLPRFSRILSRNDNAWRTKNKLPRQPNRDQREQCPAINCQYVCLKSLYEGPFRGWLATFSADQVCGYMCRSAERATQDARHINQEELAVSKIEKLIQHTRPDSIADLFDRLSEEMAGEMRLQKGYTSDSTAAQEQAKYIEDVKCDVVLLAFNDYITEGSGFDLGWLTQMNDTQEVGKSRLPDSIKAAADCTADRYKDWQKVLYTLLHLIPVGEINRLHHQMLKWTILHGKHQSDTPQTDGEKLAKDVLPVFLLYMKQHDAQYTTQDPIASPKQIEEFFACPTDLEAVYPKAERTVCDVSKATTSDRHIPARGLRELGRYGALHPLWDIFQKHKIQHADVEEWLGRTEEDKRMVEDAQKKREDLHKKWVKDKKNFNDSDAGAYLDALNTVIDHRELRHRVTLRHHIRLHDLMMTVLSRLLDYSGLWERDVYFVTLGWLYQSDETPARLFKDKGLECLSEGRIVGATDKGSWEKLEKFSYIDKLKEWFSIPQKKIDGIKNLRNDFAHFNMLRKKKNEKLKLSLTEEINKCRDLMAYDRKLKNAISLSIHQLLSREGLIVRWEMSNHKLAKAKLSAKFIDHLAIKGKAKDTQSRFLKEMMHDSHYVEMVATLFDGTAEQQEHFPPTEDNRDRNQSKNKPKGRHRDFRPQKYGKNQSN